MFSEYSYSYSYPFTSIAIVLVLDYICIVITSSLLTNVLRGENESKGVNVLLLSITTTSVQVNITYYNCALLDTDYLIKLIT